MASLGNALFSALSHTKAGKLIQLVPDQVPTT